MPTRLGREPWAGSNRQSRLPSNWRTEIRPAVLGPTGQRPCQIRWDAGCTGNGTQVDHIRPGDDHSLGNLQPACEYCHGKKSSAEGNAARPRTARPKPRHPGLL